MVPAVRRLRYGRGFYWGRANRKPRSRWQVAAGDVGGCSREPRQIS
ncbi:hypothetical protein [Lysobacter gummosus]